MVNQLNKYKIRNDLNKRLKDFTFLPVGMRFPFAIKLSSIKGDEILLDEITKEKIDLWHFFNSDIGYNNLYLNGEFEREEIRLIKKVHSSYSGQMLVLNY